MFGLVLQKSLQLRGREGLLVGSGGCGGRSGRPETGLSVGSN